MELPFKHHKLYQVWNKSKKCLVLFTFIIQSFNPSFSQAPSWVAGTPSVPSTGPLSITTSTGINMAGTIYIFAYNFFTTTVYTSAQVKTFALSGTGGNIVIALAIPVSGGNINVALQRINNVLDANRTHTLYFVAESGSGVLQAVPVRLNATTLPCPKIDILTGFTQPITCVNKGTTAVFQAVILDPPNSGILKGTTWLLDWGDGTIINYTSAADYDIPPLATRTHTYITATSCNYVFSNTVRNPCGETRSVQYVAVVHGRDIPSDGDGVLRIVNNATGSAVIQVCAGTQTIVTLRDNSTWNCQNPVLPGGFTAVPNLDPRNIEWLYGRDPMGAITNTVTGTVSVAVLGNAPQASGRFSPVPYGPASLSQDITIPATCQAGEYFRVYLKNWNKCNWTDPEYVFTSVDINVIASPPAPTASSRTICFGGNRTLTVTSPPVGTLTWYSDVTLTTVVGTGVNFVPAQTAPGSYNFWVVDKATTGLSCQSPPTMVTLTINPTPSKPTITVTGSTSFCFDGGVTTVRLTANPNTPPAITSYQWYKNGIAVGGAVTNQITLSQPSENGNYTVGTFGINPTNCPGPLSDPITITIYSLTNLTQPTNKTVCELGSTTFTASTTDPIQKWQWEVSTDGGVTWGNANNGLYYNGYNSNALTVMNTPLSFNGNRYRVQITTTAGGCIYYSNSALLTVNAIPAPTIAGPASVCTGTAGNVYSTQPGMTNYVWSVSAGGTITAGGGAASSTVTVTWNTAGARTVSVNYTNAAGCSAVAPVVYNVTVNARPAPVIAGPANACINVPGNVYSTAAGMTNYIWAVSAGGTITAGGGPASNSVTVTWTATGARTVSVNYTNAAGCAATAPTVYNVTVNPLPVPILAGNTNVCVNAVGNVYTTQAGMSNYVWTVSPGGTITAGGTPANNTVTVTWTAVGANTVSVNYTNGNGCTAAAPVTLNVTVNARPVPVIAGPANVCVNSSGNIYSTAAGMSAYAWSVTGGTITAGAGTNAITVTWNTSGAQTVSVNYNNASGCPALAPTVYNVTVNPLPVPTISGPAAVCINSTGNVYTTEAGMSNYIWTVSAGGTVTSGGTATDNSITITWNTAGARTVSVRYTNGNGCTAAAPTVFNVAVGTLPTNATFTGSGNACFNTPSTLTSVITGGSPPYKLTITGYPGSPVNGYISGTNINLGVLTPGTYTYILTSVIDNCGNSLAAGLPKNYTINVYDLLLGGTIGSSQTICYNSVPAAFTNITSPSGGTALTYQWQQSPAGMGAWTNIAGATALSYSVPVGLTASTDYRRVTTSGNGCGTEYSNVITIIVYPNLTSGSVGSAQTICYNTIPAGLTELTAPSGGTGTYTYQWQSSPDNSTWTGIGGATSSTYSPGALTATTYYRRQVTSGSCGTVNSASLMITVYGNLTPGSIGSAQSICFNTIPAGLTQITPPTGGTGTYTYQWQSSPDNSTWTSIAGATLSAYSPGALTTTIYYRRQVTSGACGTANSASVLITVYANLTPGTIGSAQTICYNTIPAGLTELAAPTGATGTYAYQWQSSPDNITWSSIAGANSSTYSPGALSATTYFRRQVNSGGCATVVSAAVLITVYGNLTAGSVGSTQTICFNTVPAGLTELTAPAGGTGAYAYQWQSSPDNLTWTGIAGANFTGICAGGSDSNHIFPQTGDQRIVRDR